MLEIGVSEAAWGLSSFASFIKFDVTNDRSLARNNHMGGPT